MGAAQIDPHLRIGPAEDVADAAVLLMTNGYITAMTVNGGAELV